LTQTGKLSKMTTTMKEPSGEESSFSPSNTNGDSNRVPEYRLIGKIGKTDVTPTRKGFYDDVVVQDPKFRERREVDQQDDRHDAAPESH
jgi:hypothetical protein